jgi:hypothetical protein
MLEKLTTLSQIIEEHTLLRRRLKLAGDTVSDEEALIDLAESNHGWQTKGKEDLIAKQQDLVRTLAMLKEGMGNHFKFEEERLPGVIGEFMTRAIAIEHRDLRREMEDAVATVSAVDFNTLPEKDAPGEVRRLREIINLLREAIEKHAGDEQVVIKLAQKVLDERDPLIRQEHETWYV